MSFDLKKFQKTKFVAREEWVDTPALAAFFEEGEKPRVKVRGLTGEEFARVNMAASKSDKIAAAIEALAGSSQGEKVAAMRELVGLNDEDMPETTARFIEMVAIGSVEPSMDAQTSAKLFKAFPIVGHTLANKITVLSAQGMVPGEARGSGGAGTSGPRSRSATKEAKCSTN